MISKKGVLLMKNIFVKTKNVKAFIALAAKLNNTQNNMPRMGLIFGEPGLGKTNAILLWAVKQDAIIVTGKKDMSTRWFLQDLADGLGISAAWYSADLFNQVVSKLIEKPRMLIVDEIDYLVNSKRTIETIRDVHDRTGIPVLMVGMYAADKKLSRYKHFFDRIVEIYRFVPFDKDDIKEIVKTLSEVEMNDDVIEIICKKANRFRQIVKLITKIEDFAATNDCKLVTKEILG